MFDNIPKEIQDQMRRLEEADAKDRSDGTSRMKRLRQIPPETGRFLAILAAAAPKGTHMEIGTSAGYSTLYLSLAAREKGCRIITFEILEKKAALARETFSMAGIEDTVHLIEGDVLQHLSGYTDISFCFLDAEKDDYLECYELVVARMVSGGILAADNADNVISHQQFLQPMLDHVASDNRVDSLVVPIGKGILLCRRI
jgi:predicted O-methyltransferase YrrM